VKLATPELVVNVFDPVNKFAVLRANVIVEEG
jgi:hypothetical protein